MQSYDWPPAHSQALRDFFAKGMSYSAIADAINAKFGTSYTRSAALGRAKRMGLEGPTRFEERGTPPPQAGPPGIQIYPHRMHEHRLSGFWRRPPVFEATEIEKLRTADVIPRHLPLLQLECGDCRYPYGGDDKGEAITFCGHPQRPDSSYCAAHFNLSVGPGTASERAADRVLLKIVQTHERQAKLTIAQRLFEYFSY